jgi:hypothetical protein
MVKLSLLGHRVELIPSSLALGLGFLGMDLSKSFW